MNKARADPKQFADLYLIPRLKNFDGKLYVEKGTESDPCGRRFLTREGAAVVKEYRIHVQSNSAFSAPSV